MYGVSRATARDLDHAAIRSYKARALNFHLDVRRPETAPETGVATPGRRQTLRETVQEFLGRRLLDVEVDRTELVRLAMAYVDEAERGDEPVEVEGEPA